MKKITKLVDQLLNQAMNVTVSLMLSLIISFITHHFSLHSPHTCQETGTTEEVSCVLVQNRYPEYMEMEMYFDEILCISELGLHWFS